MRYGKCHKHGVTEFYDSGRCRACNLKPKQRVGVDLADAQKNGLTRYYGKPCVRCGATMRYTFHHHDCVECTLLYRQKVRLGILVEKKRKTNRQKAIEKGENKYLGRCSIHGETLKYTSNCDCVECCLGNRRFAYRYRHVRAYIQRMREKGVEPTVLLLKTLFKVDTATVQRLLKRN